MEPVSPLTGSRPHHWVEADKDIQGMLTISWAKEMLYNCKQYLSPAHQQLPATKQLHWCKGNAFCWIQILVLFGDALSKHECLVDKQELVSLGFQLWVAKRYTLREISFISLPGATLRIFLRWQLHPQY